MASSIPYSIKVYKTLVSLYDDIAKRKRWQKEAVPYLLECRRRNLGYYTDQHLERLISESEDSACIHDLNRLKEAEKTK